MSTNRYKVWSIDDGGIFAKTLLLVTNAHFEPGEKPVIENVYVQDFSGTALEAAKLACQRQVHTGHVWVKCFDDDRWYTVHVPGLSESQLAQATIQNGKHKPPP